MGAVLSLPHNEFLHIAVMMGLVGLFIYVGVFASSIRFSLAAYRRLGQRDDTRRNLIVFFWAVMVVYLTNALFIDMIFFSFLNSLIFMLAGIVDRVHLDIDRLPPALNTTEGEEAGASMSDE